MTDPLSWLVPDFVMTLDSSPGAPTYSVGMPPVSICCSWMISVLRLAPNVPLTPSVTLMPSM